MNQRYIILVPLLALTLAGAGCAKEVEEKSAVTTPTPAAVTTPAPTPAADATAPATLPTYTLADVANHKTETDCWTAVDGSVYDITAALDKHPGGKEAAMRACGIDGSVLFNTRPTNSKGPHPEKAREFLSAMRIGVLAGAPQPQ